MSVRLKPIVKTVEAPYRKKGPKLVLLGPIISMGSYGAKRRKGRTVHKAIQQSTNPRVTVLNTKYLCHEKY